MWFYMIETSTFWFVEEKTYFLRKTLFVRLDWREKRVVWAKFDIEFCSEGLMKFRERVVDWRWWYKRRWKISRWEIKLWEEVSSSILSFLSQCLVNSIVSNFYHIFKHCSVVATKLWASTTWRFEFLILCCFINHQMGKEKTFKCD